MPEARESRHAFDVAPHLTSPGGELLAWFTEPAGAVVQLVRAVPADVELARWLVGPARERLYERFPGEGAFLLLVDLSAMTTRQPAFRAVISEGAKEIRSRAARSILVPPANGGAIYLKSLEVSVLLLRGFGVNVEVAKSLQAAIASLAVAPAADIMPSPRPVR